MTESIKLFEDYRRLGRKHGKGLNTAIIASFSEEDVLTFFDKCSYSCDIRDMVISKVCNDISHGNCEHLELLDKWKHQSQSTDKRIRCDASLYLSRIIPYSKGDYSTVIISFLNDKAPLIRRRGNNLIDFVSKEYEYELSISLMHAWNEYKDISLLREVCKRAPIEYIKDNFHEFWNAGTSSRIIFDRLYSAGIDILDSIKNDYPEDYIYYAAISHTAISDDEVLCFIKEHQQSEKIPLILWAVGHMRKFKVLRELMRPEWDCLFQPHQFSMLNTKWNN